MPPTISPDPVKVRAGKAGASRRWGPKRIVRLDDMPPEQRAFVVAIIDAYRRNEAGAGSEGQ